MFVMGTMCNFEASIVRCSLNVGVIVFTVSNQLLACYLACGLFLFATSKQTPTIGIHVLIPYNKRFYTVETKRVNPHKLLNGALANI